MLKLNVALILLAAVANSYAEVGIDKYLTICDRGSPEVNECLVGAVQNGLKVMAEGIKEIGVPSVDPYHQKELKIDYKNNQISATMNMKDIFVHGLKDAKVHDVRLRADEDDFHMEVDLTTPMVFVNGTYVGGGSYNSLQIKAYGDFNTTMTDLVFTWKLDGKPEKIGDHTFMRINSFYMRPDVGNMKSFIINNNPDSKELTDLGNSFANSNWKVLYKEFLPFAQTNWNKIGVRIANKLFLRVPYDELFPVKS